MVQGEQRRYQHPGMVPTANAVKTATEIVSKAKIPAVATDAENRLVACNERAKELLGCDFRGCQAGRPLFSLLDARDISGNRLFDCRLSFVEVLSQGEPYRRFEIQVKRLSGEVGRVSVTVVILLGADATEESYVYFLEPVLRRRRADEIVERILAAPYGTGLILGERNRDSGGEGPFLTPRQAEILELLADGLTDEQIATALFISVHTVRNHLRAILESLDVRNRVQAVARALRENLI